MNYKLKCRRIVLSALVASGGMQVAVGQNLPVGAKANRGAVIATSPQSTALPALPGSPSSSALTDDEAGQSAAGNVAELQQMIHSSALVELRTTYNGSYGASLLFHAQEMTYYVALFQQKSFWRVIKTQDETRADLIYKDFVRQTLQLSDVEIRRMKLEAQKASTERMIALSQGRADRLQADLSVAREQQSIVANQQQQTRAQALLLQQQKSQAQAQLLDMQRQVRELQQQLESGLPKTP
ncbi:DUF2968 domain-containing protein [Paraburkholderia bonniea]|uniref:DUF2968 domain-containing protein n=1 Tax=Paraburkholderia bonniea TaxID=2152891 RepID=UPI001290EEF3|nr:DUF2968 domain-containing protein [Paraburkholderia bonniea]WJF91291.1 DUF2968 domain-containing protein [Paraburkholderia bonniea]WJF94606.1 DUF2968 domain-containing protein [Paraburkholderia bonniea]